MEYKEFVERIGRDIGKVLPNSLQNAKIHTEQIHRMQDGSYYGIVIAPENTNMGVTIDLRSAYDQLCMGTDYEVILVEIASEAAESIVNAPKIDAASLMDYEQMKEKLMLQTIPLDRNREQLEGVPHLEMSDLAAVCRFMLDEDEEKSATVLVTNEMLMRYGVSKEQLFEDAIKYTQKHYPVSIRGLMSTLVDKLGLDESMMPTAEETMYVATCNDGQNGAGCIFLPGFFEEAEKKMGGSFYVLPSSIHEVLLLRESAGITPEDLQNMVRDVNYSEVEPEDRLSDNVYFYDAQTHTFGIASAEPEQKAVVLRDRIPLYEGTYLDAVRQREEKQWEVSFVENKHCRMEIEQAMLQEPMPDDAARSIIEQYGYMRTRYILANSVQQMGKGFSDENKQWAKSVYIYKDKTRENNFMLQTAAAGRASQLDKLVTQFRAEMQRLDLFQKDQCEDGFLTENLEGKVLVLRPEILRESCLTPENQLWLATGGFGCEAKTIGRAVMATCLSDGERCRWTRQDFCGILRDECMPDWAKEKLAELTPKLKMEL